MLCSSGEKNLWPSFNPILRVAFHPRPPTNSLCFYSSQKAKSWNSRKDVNLSVKKIHQMRSVTVDFWRYRKTRSDRRTKTASYKRSFSQLQKLRGGREIEKKRKEMCFLPRFDGSKHGERDTNKRPRFGERHLAQCSWVLMYYRRQGCSIRQGSQGLTPPSRLSSMEYCRDLNNLTFASEKMAPHFEAHSKV